MDTECVICNELYDEGNRLPRVLGCGHTFCTVCLTSLVNNKASLCPECRAKISYESVDNIPLNFTLVTVIQKTSSAASCNKDGSYSAGLCTDHGGVPKSYWCSTCKEWICVNCKTTKHCAPPSGRCIVLVEQAAVVSIKEDAVKKSMTIKELLKIFKENAIENKAKLDKTLIDMNVRKELIDEDLIVLKQKQKSLSVTEKECDEWKEKLHEKLLVIDEASTTDTTVSAAHAYDIQFRQVNKWFELNKHMAQLCSQLNLLKVYPSWTNIYAVKILNDKSMWSKVTIENDEIFLHCLTDEIPPFYAQIVQYSEFYKHLEESTIKIALEVIDSKTQSRSRIKFTLIRDNCLSERLIKTVTGEEETCIKGFQINKKSLTLSVRTPHNSTEFYEIVNEYKTNNTKNTSDLRDDDTGCSQLKNGIFACELAGEISPFKFFINSTCKTIDKPKYYFGYISYGLSSLTSSVLIEDCSIIIPYK